MEVNTRKKEIHSGNIYMVEWRPQIPFARRRAITMDRNQYITETVESKKGQHLQREEKGAIQYLKRRGLSARAIARELGCSPYTIERWAAAWHAAAHKSSKGRALDYSARCVGAVYKANRSRLKRHQKMFRCVGFLKWLINQIRDHKWSREVCGCYDRLHSLFS